MQTSASPANRTLSSRRIDVPSTDTSPPSLAGPQVPSLPGLTSPSWTIQPLQGWHLAHLHDPSFLPLLPLLQRAVLLSLPERLLRSMDAAGPRGHQVLVAVDPQAPARLLGLIVTRPQNRSRTCWQVCHLRMALGESAAASRLELATDLLRQAMGSGRGAASWVARSSSLDITRLAALRQVGFQPQLQDSLWCWQPDPAARPTTGLPADLDLQPISSRHQRLLWHLEQACTPAPLRQLLDRGIDDIPRRGAGRVLIDPSRDQAVASLRPTGNHPGGGSELELRLRPGWEHLYGPAAALLLQNLALPQPFWLRCEQADSSRCRWLEAIGAERHGDEVLMARSVWRRQPHRAALLPTRRLEAVIAQLQPGRRPLPSPTSSPW